MNKIYTFLALLFTILACEPAKKSDNTTVDAIFVTPEVVEDAYHFYVIGDWGRNGQYRQKELADRMNEVAEHIEPEFIISTGDNFYPNGVASVDDPYWQSSYENVYSGALLFCPWNVVLGNHDYRGNAQAEIDYTHVSRRWNMPARYYYQDIEEDGLSMRFIYLDTSPFEDEYYSEAKYKSVWEQDSTAQLQWMHKVMAVDTMDWKVVVGHHPLYSGGKRAGEANAVKEHLEKVLHQYNIDLYLAGHEHDMQYIKPDGPTHHIISGAGSEVRPTGMLPQSVYAASVQGFVAVSATKEALMFQMIDYTGNVLFKSKIPKGK